MDFVSRPHPTFFVRRRLGKEYSHSMVQQPMLRSQKDGLYHDAPSGGSSNVYWTTFGRPSVSPFDSESETKKGFGIFCVWHDTVTHLFQKGDLSQKSSKKCWWRLKNKANKKTSMIRCFCWDVLFIVLMEEILHHLIFSKEVWMPKFRVTKLKKWERIDA